VLGRDAYKSKVDRGLRYSCLGIAPALAVIHVITHIGLFGDGSWFLVDILDKREFYIPDAPREYAAVATQLPLVMSLKAGLKSIDALMFLHSFGLVLIPTLLWTAALAMLRTDPLFGPFMLALAVVYLNMGFFAIGEGNVAYSICVCSMAILLRDKRLGFPESLFLVALAFFATRTYETLVLTGPLLALATMVRMCESRKHFEILVPLAVSGLLFMDATVIAGTSILFPVDRAAPIAALKTTMTILWRDRQLLLSLLISLIYVVFMIKSYQKRACTFCAPAAATVLLLIAWPGDWAKPGQYYGSRLIGGLYLFAFGAIVLMLRLARQPNMERFSFIRGWLRIANAISSIERRPLWLCIPMVLAIELALIDIYQSFQFRSFIESIRNEVNSQSGLVALEATTITASPGSNYDWHWTYPSMSLLLRSDASRAILLNPVDNGWQPFDPTVAVPDLRLYYR
jgi:hypothetical protein